jgi:hypothetical protein
MADAEEFLLIPGNTDSLLPQATRQELLLNMKGWIIAGTLNEKLAESIKNALDKLAKIYITETHSKGYGLSDLTAFMITAQDRIENAVDTWNDNSYTEIMRKIFGESVAGTSISKKTGSISKNDVRSTILAAQPNTAQCTANTRLENNRLITDCWICDKAIQDYGPSIPGGTCYENSVDCEHVLGVKLALEHLNLVQSSAKIFNRNSESYLNIIDLEYEWSHHCCNLIKSDKPFIKKDGSGLYVPNTEIIEEVLRDIYNKVRDGTTGGLSCDCVNSSAGKVENRLTTVNQPANRTRIATKMTEITTVINDQINAIVKLTSPPGDLSGNKLLNASLMYEAFIKFRLLSNIPKDKIIKAMKNVMDNYDPGSSGGGKNKNKIQYGGDSIYRKLGVDEATLKVLTKTEDKPYVDDELNFIWLLNSISDENIAQLETTHQFRQEPGSHDSLINQVLGSVNRKLRPDTHPPLQTVPGQQDAYKINLDYKGSFYTFQIYISPQKKPSIRILNDKNVLIHEGPLTQSEEGDWGFEFDEFNYVYKFFDKNGHKIVRGGKTIIKHKSKKHKSKKYKSNKHRSKNKKIFKKIKKIRTIKNKK